MTNNIRQMDSCKYTILVALCLIQLTVDDQPNTTVLSLLDGLNHSIDEVRAAGTDIRTEHVRAIAFVMHPDCQTCLGVGKKVMVAENVHCQSSNGRQKDLDVRTSNQFRIHASCALTKLQVKMK